MRKSEGTSLAEETTNNNSIGTTLKDSDAPQRTEQPEYIKASELALIHPFTIYGAFERKLYGDKKISFQVAYQVEGEVQKKVLTMDYNNERAQLLFLVNKKKFIKNCRLVRISIGAEGNLSYWKFIDNDAPVPAEAVVQTPAETVENENLWF